MLAVKFPFSFFVVVTLSGLLSLQTAGGDGDKGEQLKVKTAMEYQKKEKRLLKITLTNEGKDFEYSVAALPWSHWHSMTLLVVQKNGQPLHFQEYIDDPLIGTKVFKKGQTLEGTIDLDRRFPMLAENLTKDGVDIFWSYQIHDSKWTYSKREGGFLFVPYEVK